MKMNKIYLLTFGLAFLLFGCSGKVQTNPLPDDKVFHLPKNREYQEPSVSKKQKDDFNEYAGSFFGKNGLNEIMDNSDEEVENRVKEKVYVKEQAQVKQTEIENFKKSNNIWGAGYERAKKSY